MGDARAKLGSSTAQSHPPPGAQLLKELRATTECWNEAQLLKEPKINHYHKGTHHSGSPTTQGHPLPRAHLPPGVTHHSGVTHRPGSPIARNSSLVSSSQAASTSLRS